MSKVSCRLICNKLITARKRSLGQGNIFTPVCHSVHRGGVRGCSGGVCGCSGGACMVALGWVHGCSGGHAWLLLRGGHAWLLRGGVRSCSGGCVVAPGGACMVAPGGMHGCSGGACVVALGGGRAWDTTRYGDTVNERAVRILLECILVLLDFIAN